LHCFAAGVHVVHVPPLHTLGQAAPMFTQVPVASQICGCRFVHFFAVGVQVPVHAPVVPLHTNGHAVPMSFHAPVASHFCGCSPLHFTESGTQLPLQTPPLHAFGHTAPMSCHAPVASQTCGWRLLQRVASGVQPPVQRPPLHATAQAVPVFCHFRSASQVCGWRPSHWVAFGTQPGSTADPSPVVSGDPSRGASDAMSGLASLPSWPASDVPTPGWSTPPSPRSVDRGFVHANPETPSASVTIATVRQ
jgi:hypothetical protein